MSQKLLASAAKAPQALSISPTMMIADCKRSNIGAAKGDVKKLCVEKLSHPSNERVAELRALGSIHCLSLC
jgi:hypothetical protein